MTRSDIRFKSEDAHCAGWLYLPTSNGPHACVVMGHGFGAIKESKLDAYAERFVQSGLAVLVFDYRHLGSSEGQPRQIININKQHQDWRNAIAYARSLSEIDPARVALWGTSFSGGHVITTAGHDPKLAAVVAQVPFTDGRASAGANPLPQVIRLMSAWFIDTVKSLFNGAPYMVKIVDKPGGTAALTSPSSLPDYLRMVDGNPKWINEVAARVLMSILFYRPVTYAAQIKCPLLVCLCRDDDITPAEPAKQVVQLAAQGELKEFPGGHFDLYFDEPFEQAVTAQTEFFVKHLLRK